MELTRKPCICREEENSDSAVCVGNMEYLFVFTVQESAMEFDLMNKIMADE